QRHHALFGLRPNETAALQSLGEKAQSVTIPPQQLDQIAPPPTEDEDMAGIRILLQHRLRHCAQPRETAPQIGDAGGNPDARAGRQRNHRPTRSRMRRRLSASTDPSIRIRALPTSTTIEPAYNLAGVCSPLTTSVMRTGTSCAAVGSPSSRPSR